MADSAMMTVFAELGESFGLSRPASQCFAAIWRAAQAPCADDLVQTVGISRSNVSTALKELRGYGLVSIARSPSDRREYYIAPTDPWMIARQLIAERQRRALAPAFDKLSDLEAQSPDTRIAALIGVVEAASDWMGRMARMDPADLADYMAGADTPGDDQGKKKKKHKK